MPVDHLMISNLPEIPGLAFRHFRGKSDYDPMAAVLTASAKADNVDREVSGADLAVVFTKHLTNCDPYSDMILAEVRSDLVGYTRGWWTEESPALYLYKHNAFLLPEWRRKGIGRAMLEWMEKHLKGISKKHPGDSEKYFQVSLSQSQVGAAVLLERAGYQPVRHFYMMVRPNLDDLPVTTLPEGLEVRTVKPEHYRAIWNFKYESSGEEWGHGQPTEDAYQEWLNHPDFQPDLWQIAWDRAANKVVGTVLTYINHNENKQFDRQRGYMEGVGVAQAWRRRGVVQALISRSVQVQKDAGMLESALVADSQSAFGVTRLYKSCGFQLVDRDTIYWKPL